MKERVRRVEREGKSKEWKTESRRGAKKAGRARREEEEGAGIREE